MPVKLYAVIDMNVLVSALFARDPKSNTNAYLIWCWMEQYILIFSYKPSFILDRTPHWRFFIGDSPNEILPVRFLSGRQLL